MIGSILKRVKENKGLSLIEVLVAVVLLGVAIVPMAGILSDQAGINVNSGKRFIATQLATETLEKLTEQIKGKTAGNKTGETDFYPDSISKAEVADFPGFFLEVERENADTRTVNNGANGSNKKEWTDHLVKYRVTVSWNNDAESVTMYVYHTEVNL